MNIYNRTRSQGKTARSDKAPSHDALAAHAVRKIARRARISTAHASVIAELLGLHQEVRHDQ